MSLKATRELILEGLECSNCAMKIEARVREIRGVSQASLNFTTKVLSIETEQPEKIDEILDGSRKIVKDLEPDVIVKEKVKEKKPDVKSARELILEGLECTNCAMKIEARIKEMKGITHASLNFATKTLVIETEPSANTNQIIDAIAKLVRDIEPDVSVKEKTSTKPTEKVLILAGLGCASCAGKIEDGVKKIPGVRSAAVNFMSKQLTFEVTDRRDLERIVAQIKKLVKEIEPEVEVTDNQSGDISCACDGEGEKNDEI